MKVNGLNEIAKMVDKVELTKRIEKDFISEKVAEMVKNGVAKDIALVMVKAMFECGVYNA